MLDALKKTLLASLGAVAFNKDRLQDLIDDLVARGEISREQGRTLFETLVERGQAEGEEISARLVSEIQGLKEFLPVTRRDLQALEERLRHLEDRLPLDETPAGSSFGAAETTGSAPSPSLPDEQPGEALPPRD